MIFIYRLAFVLASVPLLAACIDTSVKDLTKKENKLKLNPSTTNSLTNFRLSYASKYSGTSPANVAGNYVLLQGVLESGSAFTNTCGSTGTNCYCDFYDSSDALLGSAGGSTANIKYSSNGNFVSCLIPSSLTAANVAKARIRNTASSTYTTTTTLQTTITVANSGITLPQIVGGLDTKYVRTVYSYQCYVIGRTGTGSSSTGFACTANPFNLAHATYNYYVYQDGTTSLTGQRATNAIFNNNQFCGIMANAIDCTSINSTLTKLMGLYAQRTGAFTAAVNLYTAPPLALPGYSAGFSALQGYGIPSTEFIDAVCPLGFLERDIYTITANSTTEGSFATRLGLTTDLPDLNDVRVSTKSATETMSVKTYTANGICDGTICTVPTGTITNALSAAAGKTMPSTSTGAGTTFCALDPSFLP
jgi:hypothetical protein